MIRRRTQAHEEERDAMRGGSGRALLREYISPGEMSGVEFVSVVTLEPGACVGEHRHEGTEELYLVLEGAGIATLDGERFDVGPGDSFLVLDGHSHGLENGVGSPLAFIAVLTKNPGR
jgi:mannose-6-phosphate isomerase-like protein (cupin superfamily)